MEVAGGCYNPSVVGSGAGGSSFISGFTGCDAIEEASTVDNILHTGKSMHYSGISFIDMKMIGGNSSMPTYNGTSTMSGNSGDGHAKITYISTASSDSSLKLLKPDIGVMTEEFSPEVHEYTIKLKEDEFIVNFEIETNDPLASVDASEYINVIVPSGTSRHKINVYAEDGTRTQYIINFEREASSYKHIDGITVNGKYYEFISGKTNYEIVLPYDAEDLVEISADYIRPSQKIEGLGTFLLRNNKYETDIKVTAEDKSGSTTYHIKIIKENTNKLKYLAIAGITLTPEFSPDIEEYNVNIVSTIKDFDISVTPYDTTSKVKIVGDKNIPEGESKLTITVSNTNLEEDKVYTININSKAEITEDYTATGDYETFTTSFNGKYKIELWGAQGEVSSVNTSFGAYTSGEINLKRGENLFLYIGKSGANGGYNGGGGRFNTVTSSRTGGGATDVRLISGLWNDTTSLRSRIMVAAGGGGHSGYNPATYSGSGGGLTGYGGTAHPSVGYRGNGASQTAGGSGSYQTGGFGYGGANNKYSDGHIGGGRRRRLLRWWRNNLAFTRRPEVHHSFLVMTDVMQLQKKENIQVKAYIILESILQIHL